MAVTTSPTAEEIVARVERLPVSWWHVKTRIIIGVATFFDAFDALSIASILPAIVPMWKLTPPQIGFLISAGFLGQLLGALFFGWVAEKYGRMTGMIWSIGTFAVMSFVCAFAWNYESLLVFRLIQGFGLGGEVPIAAVYISELARTNVRGRFVMLYELIFPVGIVAASLIGLWVVPTLGWQYMFFIGAIPAVLVLFLRRVLPESPRWLASAGRLKEADAAITEIERETEKATGQPLPPPQPVVKVVEKRASLADLFGPLYLRRTLVVWLIWFTAYLVNYGLSIWMPTVYRTVFKLPLDVALRYGLITTAIGLCGCRDCGADHRSCRTQDLVCDLFCRRRGSIDCAFSDRQSDCGTSPDLHLDFVFLRQCDQSWCLSLHAGALSDPRACHRRRHGDGLAAAGIHDRTDHGGLHDCDRTPVGVSGVRGCRAHHRDRNRAVRDRNQEADIGRRFTLKRIRKFLAVKRHQSLLRRCRVCGRISSRLGSKVMASRRVRYPLLNLHDDVRDRISASSAGGDRLASTKAIGGRSQCTA